ncbi:MAG: hypothetical protein M1831_004814 [Alyxoria varia]|nr:MAG: hypothetical protein M1831_004814 [Alyxoria varia]
MGNAQSSPDDLEDLARFNGNNESFLTTEAVITSPTGDFRSKQDARQYLKDRLLSASVDELGIGHNHQHHGHFSSSPQSSTSALNGTVVINGRRFEVEELAEALRQLSKTANSDQLGMLQKALLVNETTTQKPGNSGQADISSPKPIPLGARRSSALGAPPGTATRDDAQKVLKKKKSSLRRKKQNKTQTWSPDMFVQSPLTALATLNSPSQDIQSEIQGSPSRTATPTQDRSSLGMHKLGSLRVINGIASPAMSILSKDDDAASRIGTEQEQDGYFTARSSVQEENNARTPLTDSSSVSLPSERTPTTSSPIFSSPRIQISSPDDSKNTMNTVHHSVRDSPTMQRGMTPGSLMSAHGGPFRLYSAEARSNPYLPGTIGSTKEGERMILSSEDAPPQLNVDHDSPCREKTLTNDDESIYSERFVPSRTPSATIDRIEDSRGKALDKLSGEAPRSPINLSPSEPQSDAPIKAVSHGEQVSVLSEKVTRPHDNEESQNTDTFDRSKSGDLKAGSHHFSVHGLPAPDALTSSTEKKDSAPRSFMSRKKSAPYLPQGKASPQGSPRIDVPAEVTDKTIDSPKNRPNKLQKKKAVSERNLRASIVVQGRSNAGEVEVPDVPSDIACKYTQRMSKHPTMEHLEHTYDSVSTCDTRTSSPTHIRSPIEIRFPSPTPTDEIDARPDCGSKTHRLSREPNRSPSGILRNLSGKSKERENSQRNSVTDPYAISAYADFGTVAESLGTSPYDIAASSSDRSPRQNTRGKYAHPHQISIANKRPKSMVGMDEKAAREYARQKSRDRLANTDDWSPGLGNEEHTRQSGTYYHPAMQPRPPLRSNMTEIPPLPTMSKEGRITRPVSYTGISDSRPYHSVAQSNQNSETPRSHQGPLPLAGDSDSGYAETEDAAIEDDVSSDWEAQARLWRQRRKSIGEGLRENAKQKSENASTSPVAQGAGQQPARPALEMEGDQNFKPLKKLPRQKSVTEGQPLFFSSLTTKPGAELMSPTQGGQSPMQSRISDSRGVDKISTADHSPKMYNSTSAQSPPKLYSGGASAIKSVQTTEHAATESPVFSARYYGVASVSRF